MVLCAVQSRADAPNFHPTRLLARFRVDAKGPAKAALLTKHGLKIGHAYKTDGLVRLEIAPGQAIAANVVEQKLLLRAKVKSLKDSSLFDYVEPDFEVHRCGLPSDARFLDGTLWALRNIGQSNGVAGVDIGVTNTWDITTGNTNVIVAIIDSGVRYTHQDLSTQMWRNAAEIAGNGIDDDGDGFVDDVYGINAITGSGDPMDDLDHGTHVAGTIAAAANDGHPHVGVAWNVRLMACKFLGSGGSGYTSDAAICVDYAVAHGAKILNNSWGGGGYSQALSDSITTAWQSNVLFVAAAGNSGINSDFTPFYPANYSLGNIIAVAAIDRTDSLAYFSNFGSQTVHLGAPGVDIFSSTRGSDSEYKIFSGTSMACPHVVGTAALIASAFPGVSVTELRHRLMNSVVQTPALMGKTVSGGRVNAYGALTVAPTGTPEINITLGSKTPLLWGRSVSLFAEVSDLAAITNLPVTASIGNFSNLTLLDNGVAPDLRANDGVYSGQFIVPNTSSVAITVTTQTHGKPVKKTVSFAAQAPPGNDYFTNRFVFSGTSGMLSGSNIGATSESGEPNHFKTEGAGKSVWWTWTAPSNMNVCLDSFAGSFITIMAVYTGNSVTGLTLVTNVGLTGGSGGASALTFIAKQGQQYQIAVDGDAYWPDPTDGTIGIHFNGPPIFTLSPAPQTITEGSVLALQVDAIGTPPLRYQWIKNNLPIVGATNHVLTLPPVTIGDAGSYWATVTTDYGSSTSATAAVNVVPRAITIGGPAVTVPPGRLVAWGKRFVPYIGSMPPLSSIAAGIYHNVGLRSNGTVVAWGLNENRCSPINGMSGVAAIAASQNYSLILKRDGTVIACGTSYAAAATNVPPGVTSIAGISAGDLHCVALRSNGTVIAWGNNDDGQTNVPPSLSGVRKISAGGYHTLALTQNGSVVAWGQNSVGQCNGPGLIGMLGIAAGRLHSLGIKANGTVAAWGYNYDGQCNVPAGLTNVVQVAANVNSSFAVKGDGTIVTWGRPVSIPTAASNVVALSVQDIHYAALRRDGSVVLWGSNDYFESTLPSDLNDIVSASVGANHAIALKQDGTILPFGYGVLGQVPSGATNIVAISAGYRHDLAIRQDGKVFAWGDNQFGQTNIPSDLTGVTAIAAGGLHSIALKQDGTVVCWGDNSVSQCIPPFGVTDVGYIAASYAGSVALTHAGRLWSWGTLGSFYPTDNVKLVAVGEYHLIAQLNDGSFTGWGSSIYGELKFPAGLSNVVALGATSANSLAMKQDGTIVSWGSAGYGETNVPAYAMGCYGTFGNHDNCTFAIVRPVSFGLPTIRSDQTFETDFFAPLGQSYSIEASPDLASWTTITNLTMTATNATIRRPINSAESSFFRITSP